MIAAQHIAALSLLAQEAGQGAASAPEGGFPWILVAVAGLLVLFAVALILRRMR